MRVRSTYPSFHRACCAIFVLISRWISFSLSARMSCRETRSASAERPSGREGMRSGIAGVLCGVAISRGFFFWGCHLLTHAHDLFLACRNLLSG